MLAVTSQGSIPEWLGLLGSAFGALALIAIPAVRRSANQRMTNNEAALVSAAQNVAQLEEGRKLDAEQCARDIARINAKADAAMVEAKAARSEMVATVTTAATEAAMRVVQEMGQQASQSLSAGQRELLTKLDAIHVDVRAGKP